MDYDRTPVGDDTTDDRLDGDEVYCPRCGGSFSPLIDRCPDDGTRLIRWEGRRDSLLGAILDRRFRIVRAIGEGAMGRVYEAVSLASERPVAIKVIRDALARDRAIAKRFLREARLLAAIEHPHIVRVDDYGQTHTGALFLVMELLRGRTLADELAIVRRLSPARAVAIASQLCDALDAAHAHGVIHRDLKPVNVVLLAGAGRDVVKVLDFGLAKSIATDDDAAEISTVTQTGAILGTPLYMAPEALAGTADPRSDLYALGCMLHEMLAGAPPFVDAAVNVVLARHLAEPPPPLPPDVPRALAALVARLLAKDPADRPATAIAVRAGLAVSLDAPEPSPVAAAARSTIRGVPPAPVQPVRRATAAETRRLWLVMLALVTAAVALIAAILWIALT